VNFSIVTLVNNEDVYNNNVVKSATLPNIELIKIETSHCCRGLNKGIELASSDIVICCHQDVAFPDNWPVILEEQINLITNNWGVLGTYGIALDYCDVGEIFNPSPFFRVGKHKELPSEVMFLDEHCLILNKKNGIFFDNNLSYFHFYGADICLSYNQKGFKNYAIRLHLNHLSKTGTRDNNYFLARRWLIKKWHDISCYKRYKTTTCGINL
jgi:hypothetical protein